MSTKSKCISPNLHNIKQNVQKQFRSVVDLISHMLNMIYNHNSKFGD